MQRIVLVIAFVVGLIGSVAPVDAGNPKQAAVHNRQGKAYFDAKQFDQAIDEFKKSYDLDNKPLTLFKIASAYYAKGDYAGAIEYYGKYLFADPEGPYSQQALQFTTIANKELAEAKARADAAAQAKRDAEEKQRLEAAAEQRRIAASAHVKQAEAFAAAGAWTSAGSEYRAAADAGEDPKFLIDAGEAFAKQPDEIRARDAYRAYLEKVPHGPQSDAVRGKVAELTRAIDKATADKAIAEAAEEERQRKLAESLRLGTGGELAKPHVGFKRGWIVVGGAMIVSGLAADLGAPNGDNGRLEPSDFVPVVLYGLGSAAVLRGVF